MVYKGEWARIPVAIKELTLRSLNREAQDSFERETRVMFGLRHPHITQLLAVCVELGHYCLVMEYLPKGSLFNVLHDPEESLGWAMKYKIATHIASALVHLHRNNIIHRDLKSHNVLLDRENNAKVCDFGLAEIRAYTASTSTQRATSTATMESIQGTVAWMAPECLKRGRPSDKVDVWAFGMIVWEMLTRKLPYAEAGTQAVIIHWIASGEKERIPEDTPPGLTKLIEDCWETDPARRPSATIVFDRIKALAEAEAKAVAPCPGPKTVAIERIKDAVGGLAYRVADLSDRVGGLAGIVLPDP